MPSRAVRNRESAKVFTDVPVLCGHRGLGAGIVNGHRENTLPSFRAAVAAGLRWVEVDARLTADAVLVASHDPTVNDGRFIADLTATEADELGLMRIGDLLDDLPREIAVNIEVKTSLEDALRPRARTTAALVADLAAPEAERRRLLVSSFDPSAVPIVRERAPEVPVGLLTWTRFPLRKAIPAAAHLGADVIGANVESFSLRGERPAPWSVGVAHDAGLQVAAWCPGPEQVEPLVAAGVDCLVVNHAGVGISA
jgi:glycerophosphoryl diester phosphodiesterase